MKLEENPMDVDEEIEEIEYILHCPKCGHDSSHFEWEIYESDALCPHCNKKSPKSRILVVQEILTKLKRVK